LKFTEGKQVAPLLENFGRFEIDSFEEYFNFILVDSSLSRSGETLFCHKVNYNGWEKNRVVCGDDWLVGRLEE